MQTIYKYPVEPQMALRLPLGAQPLTVQCQQERPQLWILLDLDEPVKELRQFVTYGTGQDIDAEQLTYIATFQLLGGTLIFHTFEVKD